MTNQPLPSPIPGKIPMKFPAFNPPAHVAAQVRKLIIAVDPGVSGGVALALDGNCQCFPMPATRGDLINLLDTFIRKVERYQVVAYIEHPTGYVPGRAQGASLFEFGKQAERPLAILETLGVRIIEVMPKAWQKTLNLGTSDHVRPAKDATVEQRKHINHANARAKVDWKNKLKAEAQRRFPGLENLTLKTCDALLILDAAMQGKI